MNAKEKTIIRHLLLISLGLIAIYLLLGGFSSSFAFLGISDKIMEIIHKIFDVIRVITLIIILIYWILKMYIMKDSQKYENKARTEYHVLLALLIFFIVSFPIHLFIVLLLPR